MRRPFTAFALAVEFLTVLRLRRSGEVEPALLGASLLWFPLVGLLLGCLLAVLDLGVREVVPGPPAAALVLLAWVSLTGGLHLDGLADSADGLLGGHTPEQRLAIMRDSRIGAFGAMAIGLALLLFWSLLQALPDTLRRPALVLSPLAGRAVMVDAVLLFPYARPAGLGRAYKDHAGRAGLHVAALLSVGVALLLFGPGGIVLVVAGMVAAFSAAVWASERLGGLTGDAYGAVAVVAELAVLLAVATAVRREWLQPWLFD